MEKAYSLLILSSIVCYQLRYIRITNSFVLNSKGSGTTKLLSSVISSNNLLKDFDKM